MGAEGVSRVFSLPQACGIIVYMGIPQPGKRNEQCASTPYDWLEPENPIAGWGGH